MIGIAYQFVQERRDTKGLTPKGERWFRQTLLRFAAEHDVPLSSVTVDLIARYLARWNAKPWAKHSQFRALRAFFRWASPKFGIPNPMAGLAAPKLPQPILYTMTPDKVATLIAAADSLRNKALVALLADSGLRLSEIAGLAVEDIDVRRRVARVWGKGGKEGWLVFGEATAGLLAAYMAEAAPAGPLFGLTPDGVDSVLERLGAQTGIKCNAHSFRRGFATELRRKGLGDLDIMELGRWSSVAMVQRYTRAYTFEDAARKYKPIVTES